ncbi:hypothetical protein DFJ74DRAFT_769342 [Hyaloraphidium curvatum]|nr:hypothetical protein DFJ74DRAFT_769342 [Hyaloraphidium curvatum]
MGLRLRTALVAALAMAAFGPLRPGPAPPPAAAPAAPDGPLRGVRIAILSHEMTATGAPRVCAELAAILARRGARVALHVPPRQLEPAEGEPEGASAADRLEARFRATVIGAFEGTAAERIGFYAGDPAEVASQAQIVVVSTTAPASVDFLLSYTRRPNQAVVFWVHEGGTLFRHWHTKHRLKVFEAATGGTVTSIIFISPSARASFIAYLAGELGPRALKRLPHSLTLPWGMPPWRAKPLLEARGNTAQRERIRSALGLPSDAVVFMMLSYFHWYKGHAGVAHAFNRTRYLCPAAHPRIRILALGSHMAAEKPVRGVFPDQQTRWTLTHPQFVLRGGVPPPEVPAYLAAADVFVSNAQADGESWGLALLEALFAGLPALASGVGGTLDMLGAGTPNGTYALLHSVHPDIPSSKQEVEEIAGHMCLLAEDEAFRKELAHRSQEHAVKQYGGNYVDWAVTKTFAHFLEMGSAQVRRHEIGTEAISPQTGIHPQGQAGSGMDEDRRRPRTAPTYPEQVDSRGLDAGAFRLSQNFILLATMAAPSDTSLVVHYNESVLAELASTREEEYRTALEFALPLFSRSFAVYSEDPTCGWELPRRFPFTRAVCVPDVPATLRNKGAREAFALNRFLASPEPAAAALDAPDAIVVKLSGRYRLARPDFLRFVASHPECDVWARTFGSWYLDREKLHVLRPGGDMLLTFLFAMRGRHFADLFRGVDLGVLEGAGGAGMYDLERYVVDYARKLGLRVCGTEALHVSANIGNGGVWGYY